jgi:polysaccharide biosynthesis/export protein
MGRASIFSAFAAVFTLAVGTTAQSAEPSLRPSETDVPRYASMIAPSQDDALIGGASAGPQPAPTTPVAVAPINAPSTDNPTRWQPPLLAAEPTEQVTVSATRPSQDGGYRLGTGDKLRLTVFNEPDLSGDFEIDSQGYVRLPLVGQVAAAGLTTYGLENCVAAAFIGGGYLVNPRVVVEVTTYRPFYIIGEVAKPGEYAYVNAMTAPNAIALAGGYTDRAIESEIWLRHQGERTEHEVPADQSTKIRPGDVVRVGRTAYWTVMTLLAPIISPFSTVAYLLK